MQARERLLRAFTACPGAVPAVGVVLSTLAGCSVPTAQVWSDYVGPARFVGVARAAPPGGRFDLLPPIHVVLLSHDHYDHMDLPTLQRLVARDHPRIQYA